MNLDSANQFFVAHVVVLLAHHVPAKQETSVVFAEATMQPTQTLLF